MAKKPMLRHRGAELSRHQYQIYGRYSTHNTKVRKPKKQYRGAKELTQKPGTWRNLARNQTTSRHVGWKSERERTKAPRGQADQSRATATQRD